MVAAVGMGAVPAWKYIRPSQTRLTDTLDGDLNIVAIITTGTFIDLATAEIDATNENVKQIAGLLQKEIPRSGPQCTFKSFQGDNTSHVQLSTRCSNC